MTEGGRLALVVDSLNVGGAERLVVESAACLSQRGWTVTVVALADAPSLPGGEVMVRPPTAVVRVPTARRRELADVGRIRRLAAVLRRGQFDLVHTHLGTANIVGLAAARLAGIPSVATVHIAVEPQRHVRLRRGIETFALRFLARAVVGVGPSVAQATEARLHRTVVALPNAVGAPAVLTAEERVRIRQALVGDAGRPVVVAVGRLMPVKGWRDLLEAFRSTLDAVPAGRLLIVGEGPQRQELEASIAEMGLHASVRLLGLRADVPEVLAASDLYVSASHDEGMSLALLEAMAAGLPVVVTDVGDTRAAVPDGAGIVVAPGNPRGLASSMTALLLDPGARRAAGAIGRRHVLARYGWPAWADGMENVYRSVVQ